MYGVPDFPYGLPDFPYAPGFFRMLSKSFRMLFPYDMGLTGPKTVIFWSKMYHFEGKSCEKCVKMGFTANTMQMISIREPNVKKKLKNL